MAVSVLALQSEDKLVRQAYLRRKDEIFFYNKGMLERDAYKRRAEQAELQLVDKDAQIAELLAKLASK